jgi:hypothetical protein
MKFVRDILVPGSKMELELVRASRNYLAIGGRNSIYVFSIARDFEMIEEFSDLWENPFTSLPIYDTSDRIICYTTSSPVQMDISWEDQDMFEMDGVEKSITQKAKAMASKAAKGLVENVSAAGGYGVSAIHGYLTGTQKVADNSDCANDSCSGNVIIRQLGGDNSGSALTQFKPHRNPISCMTLNKQGTMLFTASTNGTSVYAWSLMKCFSGNGSQPICLTKFSRGLTPAFISGLNISSDNKWLTCTTSRGTVHFYNIDSFSHKNVSSSIRINSRNPVQMARSMFPAGDMLNTSPRNGRLSSSVDNDTSDLGYDDAFIDPLQNIPMTFILPAVTQGTSRTDGPLVQVVRIPILCWNPFGKLSLANLEMVTKSTGSENGLKTTFSLSSTFEWDVCRRIEWGECSFKPIFVSEEYQVGDWPAMIEISTSSKRKTPFWTESVVRLQNFTLDSDSHIIGALDFPIDIVAPAPHGYGVSN